jgi:adenylylsulfate kinase
MIIQVIGLPGSGKTSLSLELCNRLNAIHLNADEVRNDLSKDLGFSKEDRVEQARRMGALSRLLSKQNQIVVADFVCPTEETRQVFGQADFVIWVDRIEQSRYEDTNTIWEKPTKYDIQIKNGKTVDEEVEEIIHGCSLFDWKKPSTLMLGRYQPWHEGHEALYNEASKRTEQVLIGVRNTHKTSEKDPLSFNEVEKYIDDFRGNSFVVKMPNITNIVYGRDVGYLIEKVELGKEIESISATNKRKELGL